MPSDTSDRPRTTLSSILRDIARGRDLVKHAAGDEPRARAYREALLKLAAKYRPWREFRHIATQLGLDAGAAWELVKLTQLGSMRSFEDLRQTDGSPFFLVSVPHLQEVLHRIDTGVGGGGPASLRPREGALGDPQTLERLRIKTWMDEAAESSLIEGASGTRRDATEMLRAGRAPKTKGERMIANNYVAMQLVKDRRDRPLSVEFLLELQTVLTDRTLERPDERGRLRQPGEHIRVVDERDHSTIYVPPDAEGLRSRLERLCAFANGVHADDKFLHPIIKASILHFMIGYEHPFCDGNGRTARAVFYWFALRHGYTIFEFMPISERIRAGFARYPRAYLDTEEEGGDLTHFVLYKADIIEQSLDLLAEHLKHEEDKIGRAEKLLKTSRRFNLRQRLLIEHALRRPATVYTVKSHMNSNGITDVTARADLEELARARFLLKTSRGKEAIYHPALDLQRRLDRRR